MLIIISKWSCVVKILKYSFSFVRLSVVFLNNYFILNKNRVLNIYMYICGYFWLKTCKSHHRLCFNYLTINIGFLHFAIGECTHQSNQLQINFEPLWILITTIQRIAFPFFDLEIYCLACTQIFLVHFLVIWNSLPYPHKNLYYDLNCRC